MLRLKYSGGPRFVPALCIGRIKFDWNRMAVGDLLIPLEAFRAFQHTDWQTSIPKGPIRWGIAAVTFDNAANATGQLQVQSSPLFAATAPGTIQRRI